MGVDTCVALLSSLFEVGEYELKVSNEGVVSLARLKPGKDSETDTI